MRPLRGLRPRDSVLPQTRSLTLGALIGAPTVREGLPPIAQHHTVTALACHLPLKAAYAPSSGNRRSRPRNGPRGPRAFQQGADEPSVQSAVQFACRSIIDFRVLIVKVSPLPWGATVTRRPSVWA